MGFQMLGGDTSDVSQVANQMNQNIAQLKVEEQTKIYKDETGVVRIIIGKLPDGTHGIVVSKEGIDARTVFT